MLFTFPSQYWYTIGLLWVFSLTGWSPLFQTGFLVSRPTQDSPNLPYSYLYGIITRHYLGNRFFFLFLRVMRCFSSPGWLHNFSWWQDFILPGCPIQKCTDQVLFADPRAFSQLTTSFFAYRSLGILCSPFVTSSCESFDIIHFPFQDNVQHRSIFVIVVPNSIILQTIFFIYLYSSLSILQWTPLLAFLPITVLSSSKNPNKASLY